MRAWDQAYPVFLAARRQVIALVDQGRLDEATVLRSGDAFNVVPAEGELICDVRADSLDALRDVLDAVPAAVGGATLRARHG